MFLLKLTHRPLVSPPIPEREYDPSTDPSPSLTLPDTSPSSSRPPTPDHLRNNVVPLPPHPILTPTQAETSAEDYLLPKALTSASVKPSTSLIRTLSGPRDWLAEIIYVARPLIYGETFALNIYF